MLLAEYNWCFISEGVLNRLYNTPWTGIFSDWFMSLIRQISAMLYTRRIFEQNEWFPGAFLLLPFVAPFAAILKVPHMSTPSRWVAGETRISTWNVPECKVQSSTPNIDGHGPCNMQHIKTMHSVKHYQSSACEKTFNRKETTQAQKSHQMGTTTLYWYRTTTSSNNGNIWSFKLHPPLLIKHMVTLLM